MAVNNPKPVKFTLAGCFWHRSFIAIAKLFISKAGLMMKSCFRVETLLQLVTEFVILVIVIVLVPVFGIYADGIIKEEVPPITFIVAGIPFRLLLPLNL